jgi:hypothetical protein
MTEESRCGKVGHPPKNLMIRISWIVFAGALLFGIKVASDEASGTPLLAGQVAPVKPDLGSVSNNVYTNDSSGLTYTFPIGWSVDKDAMDSINEQPAYASGQAPNKSPLLLMVSQQAEEVRCEGCSSHTVRGPRILIYARAVPSPSKDQTSNAVLLRIKQSLEGSQSAKIVREPADCSFGGQTFSRMDVKWASPKGGVSYSGDAVTIRRGYLIQFTIFAESLGQLDELFQTLNSLQFKPLA